MVFGVVVQVQHGRLARPWPGSLDISLHSIMQGACGLDSDGSGHQGYILEFDINHGG